MWEHCGCISPERCDVCSSGDLAFIKLKAANRQWKTKNYKAGREAGLLEAAEVAEAEKRDETTDSYELHKKAFELFLARPDTQETLQKLYEAQFSEGVE